MVEEESKRLFLPFLDGIRGLAALLVVFHHVWQFTISAPTGSNPSWFGALSVLKYGGYGVSIFVVVSGFCLMLPEVPRGESTVRGGLLGFGKRRLQRLLPGYYAAFLGTLLLTAFVPKMRVTTGGQWDITLPLYSFGGTVSHLLAVHNLSETWRWTVNPPLWSAALELQIYAVFAIALLPLARRFGTLIVALGALAVSCATVALGFGFAHPWMLGLFALGMVGAELVVGGRQAHRLDAAVLAVGAALVTVTTVVAERVFSGDVIIMVQETVAGVVTLAFVVILGSRFTDRSFGVEAVRSVLLLGWVQWTGRVSYSLYLVHYPIVAFLSLTFVSNWAVSVPVTFALLALMTLPVSAVVSWLFFRAFEQPFLRWRESSRSLARAKLASS